MLTRKLEASDAAAAIALWHEAGVTRPWNDPVADFERALAGPASAVLGGFVDDELVATAMVGHDGHRGWVYYLAVTPARQLGGYGRALMCECEAWLRARRIPKVNVMIRGSNREAAGFYDSLGYGTDDVVVRAKRLE